MFIINPDPYSLPCYHIGPFQTKDLSKNRLLAQSDKIDNYFKERFEGREFMYTENGRKAINLALSGLELKKNDVVTILTTSGNFYISGCVTKEIEKFCKWSREFLPETKVIFLNHEFGFPYHHPEELKKYDLPIIEDCANTFFSGGIGAKPGSIGDFVVYSFPKTFPLQIGGLLVANDLGEQRDNYEIESEILIYIKNVLSQYIDSKEEIVDKRIKNYNYLKEKFTALGFPERFTIENEIVPGVFMFKTDKYDLDLQELKNYYYDHGIQCSVFYGEKAFFLPVHQGLIDSDLDYFYEVFKSFLLKNNLI